MVGLIRFLKGTVGFTVSGGFPERFMNLCANRGLPLWDSARREEAYCFTTWPSVYKRLRPCAKKAGCRLKVRRRRGLPFLLHRYRKRWGIAAGAAVFLIFMGVMSLFVWNVQVSGNVTVDSRVLLQQLETLGVKAGTLRSSLDARDIERQMMLHFDEIGWIGVNLSGSTARVEIHERSMPPEIFDSDVPFNVVAAKAGQIDSMEIYEGAAMVQKGDAVAAGDILVSGVIEDKDLDMHLVHARARVTARVEAQLTVAVDYEQVRCGYRDTLRRYSLKMFSLELPLWVGKAPEQPYKLERMYSQAQLFGFTLPVELGKRQYILLEELPYSLTAEEALAEAEKQLIQKERQAFGDCELLQRSVEAEEQEDCVVLTGTYIVLEDIAKQMEIFTN